MNQHNQTHLKDALEAMLEHYKLKRKYNQARLKDLWPKLMGPAIQQYTTAIKLHKKTLFVNISSAPLRQELSMGTEQIKDMLNKTLGEDFIEKVVIR